MPSGYPKIVILNYDRKSLEENPWLRKSLESLNSPSFGINAAFVQDDPNAQVIHFNVRINRPLAGNLEKSLAAFIDRKTHELQPPDKRNTDGICKGTGLELDPDHWHHVPAHVPRPGENYYAESLRTDVKIYKQITNLSAEIIAKLTGTINDQNANANANGYALVVEEVPVYDRVPDPNGELKIEKPVGSGNFETYSLQKNPSKTTYAINAVGLPSEALRGDFWEASDMHKKQKEFLVDDPARMQAVRAFETVDNALKALRDESIRR